MDKPWVVTDEETVDENNQYPIIGQFATESEAEALILKLATDDPEKVARGAYGLVGPADDEG